MTIMAKPEPYHVKMGKYLAEIYKEDWSQFDPSTQDIRIRECETHHYSFRICEMCGTAIDALNDGCYNVYKGICLSCYFEDESHPTEIYIDPSEIGNFHD